MFPKLKEFVRSERGDAVVWVVLIIVGVIIAVTVWKYVGGGVRNAAKAMGNALSGQ